MDEKFYRKYLFSRLDTVQREAEVLKECIALLDKGEDKEARDVEEATPPKKTSAKTEVKKGKAKAEPEETEELEAADDADELDLESDEESEPELTVDDVRKTVKTFALKHGKDKALKLLQKFKTTSISDLKKTDYSKVIELAQKHL